MSSRVKVVVTGAAGQIAYSLIPRLVDGKTFGNRTVDLCLVEIPQVVSKLKGLVMELEDSYFPHMGEVTYTDNFEEASHDADWFLLVGSIPRGISIWLMQVFPSTPKRMSKAAANSLPPPPTRPSICAIVTVFIVW